MSDWLQKTWHPWITVSPDAVFRVVYPKGHTFEQTVEVFRAIERFSSEADRDYAVVVDMGQMTRSDARGRAQVAASEERIGAMACVQRHNRGVAVVVRNDEQRAVMTGVAWRTHRPYPYEVFGTLAEAEAWVAKNLGLDPARVS